MLSERQNTGMSLCRAVNSKLGGSGEDVTKAEYISSPKREGVKH